MNQSLTYLLIDLGAVCVPFLFSFHPRLRFDREWKFALPPMFAVAVFFILWDMLYTHLGVWHFNPRYLTGMRIANLPLEEVLFFLCIPYASVFSYHCFRVLGMKNLLPGRQTRLVYLLMLLLVVVGLLSLPRLYTAASCLLTVVYLWINRRALWLGFFMQSWTILLLPFFIVNGLLTGTGLEEAVVLYNPEEFLGYRALTIPLEDFVYGFLMLGMSVQGYAYLRQRAGRVDTVY